MQGEPDCTRLALLLESIAKKLGQKHEVIIMNPDQDTSLRSIRNCICKELVDSLIGLPWTIVEGYAGLVMEDRPKDSVWIYESVSSQVLGAWIGLTREAVIVLMGQITIQEDRGGTVLRQTLRYFLAVLGILDLYTGPAEPAELRRFGQSRQSGHEATTRY